MGDAAQRGVADGISLKSTMRELQKSLAEHRHSFGWSESNLPVVVRAMAPWRDSLLTRCSYLAFPHNRPELAIRLMERKTLLGVPCPADPYSPTFHQVVSELLPKRRGYLAESELFWAEEVRGRSLLSIKEQAWSDAYAIPFLRAFWTLQSDSRDHQRNYGSFLVKLCDERVSDPTVRTLAVRIVTTLLPGPEELSVPVRAGWSHGDLWPADVLQTNTGFVVLDWEWSTPLAPLGSDLIDFWVASAEHHAGYSPSQAWTALVSNDPVARHPLLEYVRSELTSCHPDSGQIMKTLRFALARCCMRALAQDGPRIVPYVEAIVRDVIPLMRAD
jgi:hypothetical protein